MQKENHVAFKNMLRTKDILKIFGFSRSTLYIRIKDGSFPAPAKNGITRVWSEKVVKDFQDSMLAGELDDRQGGVE